MCETRDNFYEQRQNTRVRLQCKFTRSVLGKLISPAPSRNTGTKAGLLLLHSGLNETIALAACPPPPSSRAQDETCGGLYAFDLYKLEWADEPKDDPEYIGCFGDTKSRVMSDMYVDPGMTPAMCRGHCEGKGNNYYATQVC